MVSNWARSGLGVAACLLPVLLHRRLFSLPHATPTLFGQALNHGYKTEILSTDPLVIFLDEFISPNEASYLLKLGEPLYAPSRVFSNGTDQSQLPLSYRTSSSCVLPGGDPIVSTVAGRALAFIGFLPHTDVEALQLVRYREAQLFGMHYDWFYEPLEDSGGRRYNRLASFFVYLEVNFTSGGQTYFPELPPPPLSKCDDKRFGTSDEGVGLALRPEVGSGVFWINLLKNGSGDVRTLHAGLPVGEGTKTGMNIWIKTDAK